MQEIRFSKILAAHSDYAQHLICNNPQIEEAITEEIFLSQRFNNSLSHLMTKENPNCALPIMHWSMVSSYIHALFVQCYGLGIYSYVHYRRAIETLANIAVTLKEPKYNCAWVTNMKARPIDMVSDWELEVSESLREYAKIPDEELAKLQNHLEYVFSQKNTKRILIGLTEEFPDIREIFLGLMPLSNDKNADKECMYSFACSYASHANSESTKPLFYETRSGIELQPFPEPNEQHFLALMANALTAFHDSNLVTAGLASSLIGHEFPIEDLNKVKQMVDNVNVEIASKFPNGSQ